MTLWRKILPVALAFVIAMPPSLVVQGRGRSGRPALVVARPGPGR